MVWPPRCRKPPPPRFFVSGASRKTRGSVIPSRTRRGAGGCGRGTRTGRSEEFAARYACARTEVPRERSPSAPSSSAREDARVRRRRRRFARASRGHAHGERRVAERVAVRPRPEELLPRQRRALVVHRDDLRALALHGTHPGGEVLHRRRHREESASASIFCEPKKRKRSRRAIQRAKRKTEALSHDETCKRYGGSRPKSAAEIPVRRKRGRKSSAGWLAREKSIDWNAVAKPRVSSCKIRPEKPSPFPARRDDASPGRARHNRRRPCRARKFVTRTHRATRRSELLTFAHTPTPCPPSPPT